MDIRVAILNTSILTQFGAFTYRQVDIDAARQAVEGEILSAVGHDATAEILSTLLGRAIPVNRIKYEQPIGEPALVFKLRGRIPEGKILTVEEIEAIGYDFGILDRVA